MTAGAPDDGSLPRVLRMLDKAATEVCPEARRDAAVQRARAVNRDCVILCRVLSAMTAGPRVCGVR